MRVPVFLSGWEIECCQPPPGLGDSVEWLLEWIPAATGPGLLEAPWQAVRPLPRGIDADRSGVQLQHGSMSAWWRGAVESGVPTRGRLLADMHGGVPDELPATRGRVSGVEVVNQAYRLIEPRGRVPIEGDVVLRSVDRSPAWFGGGTERPLAEVMREESGVLVLLDVDSTATSD